MNTTYMPHPETLNPINEISSLLAKAIFLKQKRQANQHVQETCEKQEKELDDVAHQAIVVSERDSNLGERRRK